MGLMSGIKTKMKNAVGAVKSAVKGVTYKAKTFVETCYGKIEDILWPPKNENPEETDRKIVSGCHEAIKDALGSSPFEQFASLEPERRKDAVENITSQVAEAMGVKIDNIDIRELNDGLCGYHSCVDNRICYNEQYLYEEPMTELEAKEVIDTIVHEVRHAYQRKAACRPSRYGRDKLTAEIWRTNFKHYVSSKQNMELYYKQPVEVDAREIASYVIKSFE